MGLFSFSEQGSGARHIYRTNKIDFKINKPEKQFE